MPSKTHIQRETKTQQIHPASSQAGFSLLELTIALSILGILGTLALPFATQYRHQRAMRATKDHQDRIIKSLECYLVQNNCLPHPEALPSNETKAPATTNTRPTATPEIFSHDLVGIVPYYKLGLPEAVAKDGYGHFMTYVVAADACSFGTHTQDYRMGTDDYALPGFCGQYDCDKDNIIEIWDEKNNSVLKQNDIKMAAILSKTYNVPLHRAASKDCIVFALISHGADGAGKAGSPEEAINNQAQFKQHKIVLRTQPHAINPNRLFRHRLVWGTKQAFAGFCKAEKMMLASKNLNKTVQELEKLTQTIKDSADVMNKIKTPLSRELLRDKGGAPSALNFNSPQVAQQPSELAASQGKPSTSMTINDGTADNGAKSHQPMRDIL